MSIFYGESLLAYVKKNQTKEQQLIEGSFIKNNFSKKYQGWYPISLLTHIKKLVFIPYFSVSKSFMWIGSFFFLFPLNLCWILLFQNEWPFILIGVFCCKKKIRWAFQISNQLLSNLIRNLQMKHFLFLFNLAWKKKIFK